MKNLKLNTGIIVAILILSIAISCKDNKKENKNHKKHQTEMKGEAHSMMTHNNADGHHNKSIKKEVRTIVVNNQKNTATTLIVEAYIEIKNGLATDNKDNAAKGGTSLVDAFSVFDMAKLSTENHKEYMEIMESAKEHAEHIIKSDIKHQREHFLALSTDIIDIVALLGTEEPYLSKARDRIVETYDVEIPLCANGFYDKAEYPNMIAMKDIDMVILAMGMPKQEEVALSLKHAISKPCLIVCGGAVLDFIAGRFERAPLVLQKMRLEWFYRLCKEPARLFNRYVIGIPAFLFRLARI